MLNRIIKIEGGLGSQILGLITFLHCVSKYQTKGRNRKCRLDLSYFDQNLKKPYKLKNGLTVWPWALDEYGYHIDSLREKSARRYCRLVLHQNSKEILKEALNFKWNKEFPSNKSLLKSIFNNRDEKFTAVHIRGGDYLNVSSKVIRINDVLPILKNVQIDNQILFFSDTNFNNLEKKLIFDQFQSNNIIFLDSSQIDQHEVHGVMRHANLLVMSNSTFSFSASVLREVPMRALAPTHFFSTENIRINSVFQGKSDWMWL